MENPHNTNTPRTDVDIEHLDSLFDLDNTGDHQPGEDELIPGMEPHNPSEAGPRRRLTNPVKWAAGKVVEHSLKEGLEKIETNVHQGRHAGPGTKHATYRQAEKRMGTERTVTEMHELGDQLVIKKTLKLADALAAPDKKRAALVEHHAQEFAHATTEPVFGIEADHDVKPAVRGAQVDFIEQLEQRYDTTRILDPRVVNDLKHDLLANGTTQEALTAGDLSTLDAERLSAHFGVTTDFWQGDLQKEAGSHTIPQSATHRVRDMLAMPQDKLDKLVEARDMQVEWLNQPDVDIAAILDPVNVLAFRNKLIADAVGRGLRERDVTKAVEAGQAYQLDTAGVAAYFGTTFDRLHAQRNHQPGPIPKPIMDRFLQMIAMRGATKDPRNTGRTNTLELLAEQYHAGQHDATDTSPMDRVYAYEQSVEQRREALAQSSISGRSIDEQLETARANTLNMSQDDVRHEALLRKIEEKFNQRMSEEQKAAQEAWPMVYLSDEQQNMLFTADAIASQAIIDQLDPTAKDFGRKARELRLQVFSDKIGAANPARYVEVTDRLKAALIELPVYVDQAADIVIDKQFGSVWLIGKELGLHESQAKVVMNELEKRGIVGPHVADGQRREVLVSR
jgi:hypothetical protein